jgi:hypothetical protein
MSNQAKQLFIAVATYTAILGASALLVSPAWATSVYSSVRCSAAELKAKRAQN